MSQKPTTYIDIPKLKPAQKCSTITYAQLKNGDFFTLEAPDFRDDVFLMLDKTKNESGQCILISGWARIHWPYLTWFDYTNKSNRFIVYKDIVLKNPTYQLT